MKEVSSGKIIAINYKLEFVHSLDAINGNSGSPICLKNDIMIVGIQKQGDLFKSIKWNFFRIYN